MPDYLLKLSGEALGGDAGFGIEPDVLRQICDDIVAARKLGARFGIVLGGGNLFRGQTLAENGLDRVVGDRMGMLATIMNGLAMGDFLTQAGVPNTVFAAAAIPGIVNGYHRDTARQVIDDGGVAILTGGTGNPFFTTDTAACLRGIELGVDAVLKATNVDGVYDADPRQHSNAKRYDEVSYDQVLAQELGVMDLTAIVLCKEQQMPLIVFDMHTPGNLVQIAQGVKVGTRVVEE